MKSSTVNPDHDWQFLIAIKGWRPNVKAQTILARIKEGAWWLVDQLKFGAALGRAQGQDAAEAAKTKAAEVTQKTREEL